MPDLTPEEIAAAASAGITDEAAAAAAKATRDAAAIAVADKAAADKVVADKVIADKAAADAKNEEHRPGDDATLIGDAKKKAEDEATAKAAADKAAAEAKDYTVSGDANIDSIIGVLKDFKVERAESEAIFGDALKTQDITKIDVARLEKAVGASTAKMIMGSLERNANDATKLAADHATSIYDMAGGKDKWEAAAKFVTETDHFPAAEAEEINAMLAKGGRAAKSAVADIVAAYKGSTQYKEVATLLDVDAGTSTDTTPLSRVDYFDAVNAERNRKGGPRKHVVDALNKQRLSTMKAAKK